jgi:hypothetical protein
LAPAPLLVPRTGVGVTTSPSFADLVLGLFALAAPGGTPGALDKSIVHEQVSRTTSALRESRLPQLPSGRDPAGIVRRET